MRKVLISLASLSLTLVTLQAQPAAAKVELDLETLTGAEAISLMAAGKLTSVELTKAYIDRITALNKRGPGLNAVTDLNPNALKEAEAYDRLRKKGKSLGPAMGLPILLKDLIDVVGMPTTANNWSLRQSFPATDAGITKKLKERGVVILGKVGLSEYANSFGNQPSGFGNYGGQVINGIDADQNPSGSSSGTGAAMAAALSTLGIGTETSGSIISPSNAQSLVGLRPTVGLVPGYGIAPISASQDIAGPMVRTVSDAALTLASIAGPDPVADAGYKAMFGDDYIEKGIIPALPATLPDYMKALDPDFVRGKKIGYNGNLTEGSPLKIAYDALVAAGAIMVPRPTATVPSLPALPSGYEQHKSINSYYERLGPQAPIKSLLQEIQVNQAEAHQALKFGNNSHLNASLSDVTPGGANEQLYRTNLAIRKAAWHKAIDDMMTYTNSDPAQPADPVIAILGSTPSAPQAGYPTITIPMGYTATQRRAQNVAVHGGAYDEFDLIGVAYVIEQATKLRQPASLVNPSMYRCAKTTPAPPFAARGGCNPDYDAVLKVTGYDSRALPFSLETETATSLLAKLKADEVSAEELTRAYLDRIALTNAEGPAIQAVREINVDAIKEARKLDHERGKYRSPDARPPLWGLPVLVNDTIDAKALATTGGSIALQGTKPADDSAIVAKLKAAGAIVLGKTNVTELNGVFDANLPKGYSSLGGQVLLPNDTDKTPAGSSAGAAAATASGLAAITIGMETSPDSAQLLAPADAAGVVGLKPTVGLVSTDGVLPVAKSQDAPGPITRSVGDAAAILNVIADPAAPVDYTKDLKADALAGKKIAVVSSTSAPYQEAIAKLQGLGATVTQVSIAAPAATDSVVATEFKRDLNAYLAETKPGTTLQSIIDYNLANPVEGLKYQQGQLLAAQAVDLSDPATNAKYTADLANGKAANQAVLDTVLGSYDLILVPSGSNVIGYADRAGYPALTIPAGYGVQASSAGRNPIGVTLIGGAFSEAKLLAGGYALEQAIDDRLAPSYTNPSMWRCVPESTFFTGEFCLPGDRQAPRYKG
ncbi:amidase family protein [Herbidospora cretacea]|uniref:amidase family protein n=1 Tax=Herbidospora cretacea TaxID=28444 RepID=UPI000A485D96|nr:amidase family protein [Herbidospora cretacea]